MARSNHHTGAAGVLAVAAELSRRGYDAAITLGNTPTIDIICSVPEHKPFRVQVKSVSYPNWVQIRKEHLEHPDQDLYFAVVLVPVDAAKPFAFHILTHAEVCNDYKNQSKNRKDGKPLKPGREGVAWAFVEKHLGRWDKLLAS
jgi:hypothetical protein